MKGGKGVRERKKVTGNFYMENKKFSAGDGAAGLPEKTKSGLSPMSGQQTA